MPCFFSDSGDLGNDDGGVVPSIVLPSPLAHCQGGFLDCAIFAQHFLNMPFPEPVHDAIRADHDVLFGGEWDGACLRAWFVGTPAEDIAQD